MFSPNANCIIYLSSGKTDVYGQALPGTQVKERCSVVKLDATSTKSSARADVTPSLGSARELESNANILLTKTTQANIDDIIEVWDTKVRILSMQQRRDVTGQLDHFEITAQIWK